MAQKLIEVHDLKKYYNGGDVKALDGVTADVYKGDVIAVIGPSGGGKSTFLRSLNLLETPTSGSILFDGVDITGKKVDLPLHRQKMGMVFQHFNLFPNKTVLDNLTMAPIKIKKVPKSEAEQKAMALLQRVGLADRANDYPAQLSGGQKQRVAIVRALAMEPEVGVSSRFRLRRNVLLPPPEGPITAMTLPLYTSTVTPSSALTSPPL